MQSTYAWWLVALVVLMYAHSSSFPYSMVLSVAAVEVTTSLDIACDNAVKGSYFAGMRQRTALTIASVTGIQFGAGGAAWTNGALSWSACAHNSADKKGACTVCDRPDKATAFVKALHCYDMYPSDRGASDLFGLGGAAWGNNGLSWSACSSSAGTGGVCYVCDRDDVGTRFVWADHCRPVPLTNLQLGDDMGFGGAAWGNGGLTWSACSHGSDANGKPDTGVCQVCERVAVEDILTCTAFLFPYADGEKGDNFGYGGAALGSGGLSWSACSHSAKSNGIAGAGQCHVCDRESKTALWNWDAHCYALSPIDGVSANSRLGKGGVALGNGGLSWSACADAEQVDSKTGAGKCYVCERDNLATKFDWNTHCYSLVPTDIDATVYFGDGGPTWTDDGLGWSACASTKDDSTGECYICARSDVATRFVWEDHCGDVLPDPSITAGKFGSGGSAWSSDITIWSACSSAADVLGVKEVGECYICK